MTATCAIVIPLHNEAATLRPFLLKFWKNLGDLQPRISEIHLVENGSTDNTLAVAHESTALLPAGIVRPCHVAEASYGAAIRHGIMESRADVLCILEADLMDTDFVRRSLALFDVDTADFIVASKCMKGAVDNRPFKRRFLTFSFNLLLKIVFRFQGTDTHGLKAMKTNIGQALMALCQTSGEALQTELVMLAWRAPTVRIVEIPLELRERRAPPISILKRVPRVWKFYGQIYASLLRFRNTPPEIRIQRPSNS